MKRSLLAAAISVVTPIAFSLEAQATPRLFIEARGGAVVPTFDIADVISTGGAFGATLGLPLGTSMVLMAEFDRGMHKDEPTDVFEITTNHYMAKLGFLLGGPKESGVEILLNLGAGMVNFDFDGGESNSYFAINAGAKIAFALSPSLALVLSPQGDIAFTDEDEEGASTAWVWPLTAGLRIRL